MTDQIVVECLRCGHCSLLPESRLIAFGEAPGAPIAKFVHRLTCQECGSHSVKAWRADAAPRAWPPEDIARLEDAVRHGGSLKETAALLARPEDEVDRQARLMGLVDSPPVVPKD